MESSETVGVETDQREASPAPQLHELYLFPDDRTAEIRRFSTVAGLVAGLVFGLSWGCSSGWSSGWAAAGIAGSITTGCVAAWLARTACHRGWKRFLTGVRYRHEGWLRVTDAYEFRHRDLLDYLAANAPPPPPSKVTNPGNADRR